MITDKNFEIRGPFQTVFAEIKDGWISYSNDIPNTIDYKFDYDNVTGHSEVLDMIFNHYGIKFTKINHKLMNTESADFIKNQFPNENIICADVHAGTMISFSDHCSDELKTMIELIGYKKDFS